MALAQDSERTRPYELAAFTYRNAGWPSPLPIRGKYPPPTGWTGAVGGWPSGPDIQSWIEDRGGDNIGLRLPPTVLGIDVDNYADKRGKETLAECETVWGPLPETWRSTSRSDGTSGIRIFAIPPDLAWPGQLPGGGVELILWSHRYVVVPPSLHPNGGTYRWTKDGITTIHEIPSPADLPELPQRWVDGLVRGTYIHEAKIRLGAGQAASWLTELAAGHEPPCSLMRRRANRLHRELIEPTSRHESALTGVLDLVRRAEEGHPGILTALSSTGETFVDRVTGDDTRTADAAWGEWKRMVDGAVARVLSGPLSPQLGDPCVVLSDPPYHPNDLLPAHRAMHAAVPVVTAPPVQSGAGGADIIDEESTWLRELDMADLLAGRLPDAPPTELARSDGVLLLYAGKVNGLLGPSESGKTWVALLGASQAIQAGRNVTMIDFEDTGMGAVGRLRALGVPDELIAAHFTYLAPAEPLTPAVVAELCRRLSAKQTALIILDGVNAAMTTMGLDLQSNKDATQFHLSLLLPLSRTGAAVGVVDHTPKNDAEGLSKGGIGAQAKRAAMTGAAIRVEVITPFSRSHVGLLKLTVDKDRGGHVRMAAEGGVIGMAHLEPGDDGTLAVRIEPQESAVNEAGEFRPTVLMERVADYLADNPGANVRDLMREHLGKDKYVRDAIDYLVQDGHVSRANGPNRQVLHTLIRVYPASASQVSPGVAAPGVSGGVARGGTEYPPPSHTNAVGTHLRNSHTQDPPEFDYGDDPADE